MIIQIEILLISVILNNDIMTLYAHCKTIYVKEGDSIKQGQAIAQVGATGNVTGLYDAYGNSWEMTMPFYDQLPPGSNMPLDIQPKHYEIYTSTDISKACNNNICYGRAYSETAGWYNSGAAGLYPGDGRSVAFGSCIIYERQSCGVVPSNPAGIGSNTSSRMVIQSK